MKWTFYHCLILETAEWTEETWREDAVINSLETLKIAMLVCVFTFIEYRRLPLMTRNTRKWIRLQGTYWNIYLTLPLAFCFFSLSVWNIWWSDSIVTMCLRLYYWKCPANSYFYLLCVNPTTCFGIVSLLLEYYLKPPTPFYFSFNLIFLCILSSPNVKVQSAFDFQWCICHLVLPQIFFES